MIGSGHYHLSPKSGGTNSLLRSYLPARFQKLTFSAASNDFLHFEFFFMSASPLTKILPKLNKPHPCSCPLWGSLVHSLGSSSSPPFQRLQECVSSTPIPRCVSHYLVLGLRTQFSRLGDKPLGPQYTWVINSLQSTCCGVTQINKRLLCFVWCYLGTSCYGENKCTYCSKLFLFGFALPCSQKLHDWYIHCLSK